MWSLIVIVISQGIVWSVNVPTVGEDACQAVRAEVLRAFDERVAGQRFIVCEYDVALAPTGDYFAVPEGGPDLQDIDTE